MDRESLSSYMEWKLESLSEDDKDLFFKFVEQYKKVQTKGPHGIDFSGLDHTAFVHALKECMDG